MKATLIYSLYRRPGPTNEKDANGYLQKGSTIEVQKMEAGASIDGISVWFFADDGFWYWGGGVELDSTQKSFEWKTLTKQQKMAVVSSIIQDQSKWIEQKVLDYVGCAVGYKNDDLHEQIGLTVFVTKKTDTYTLGKTLTWRGIEIPVDFKETGGVEEHLNFGENDSDSSSPKLVGGSIKERSANSWGTRSMCLYREHANQRDFYLAACFHVLLNKRKGTNVNFDKGDNILKGIKAQFPAKDPEFSELPIEKAVYNEKNDFCLVRLSGNDLLNRIDDNYFSDFYRFSELQNLERKTLTMCGAKSGKQEAVVTDISGSIKFNSSPVTFQNLIITGKMSLPGDSGAPVIDEHNNLVGIVIGGDKETRTYILPVFGFLVDNDLKLSTPFL